MDVLAPKPPRVDCRNATRVVPMKFLCLGLSTIGSQSLREARFRTGFEDGYHQTSVNQNEPHDAEFWLQAFRNKFEGEGGLWMPSNGGIL